MTYPDLPTFFKESSDKMKIGGFVLEKNVTTEGKTTSKKIVRPNWLQELQPFMEINLNSPSLKGAVQSDTLSGSPLTIRYTITDPDPALRQIAIRFNGTMPDSLAAVYMIDGIYGSEKKYLEFVSQSRYQIKVNNHPAFGKSTDLEITGMMHR